MFSVLPLGLCLVDDVHCVALALDVILHYSGRADVVRLLKDESEFLDINVRTQKGPAFTPLHLASERGHIDTVIALIDCGASLSAVDRRCRTAKDIAIEKGHRKVIVAIIAAEVEKETGQGNLLKMTEVRFIQFS